MCSWLWCVLLTTCCCPFYYAPMLHRCATCQTMAQKTLWSRCEVLRRVDGSLSRWQSCRLRKGWWESRARQWQAHIDSARVHCAACWLRVHSRALAVQLL